MDDKLQLFCAAAGELTGITPSLNHDVKPKA